MDCKGIRVNIHNFVRMMARTIIGVATSLPPVPPVLPIAFRISLALNLNSWKSEQQKK